MACERVVLCGGAPIRGLARGVTPLTLDLDPRRGNVKLHLEAIRHALWKDFPPVLRDLLDLAAYVYAADQATCRGNGGKIDGDEIGAGWRRKFRFRIPAREADLWNSASIQELLVAALSFLSEDEYAFEFVRLKNDTSLKDFIDFDATPFDGEVEEVVMFSGGVDSLAGAVTEAVVNRRQVLLVNHRSNDKLAPQHARILHGLAAQAGDRKPVHFPIRVNKAKRLGKETTQRTRSFLFAALGTLFARMVGLDRLRFYENGVTSLNLPPSSQVVGARASRTTHPRVLAGFERLVTALVGRPFAIENPFLWETKTDVVKRLADAGCGQLLGLSMSCGHTWELKTKTHTHCGVCSQCIDRRFAVLAAGQEANDPAGQYAVDLLVGDRQEDTPKAMLAGYLDLADRVERMGEAEFLTEFGEVARVLPHLDLPTTVGAARVFAVYKRHAQQVNRVITEAIRTHAEAIRRKELPRNCLLRLVYDEGLAGASLPVAAEPVRPQGNYFLPRSGFWAIRFGTGEENIYPMERGFEYLRILLGSPERHFTASELASRVGSAVAPNRPRAATADEAMDAGVGIVTPVGSDTLDAEALEALHTRLGEINEARELVGASDSPTRLDDLDELDAEERAIRDRLGRDRRLDGRPRQLGDVRDRVRNRVCNAIRRALKVIDRYDPSLAEHFKRPHLHLGHTICYTFGSAGPWSLGD